MSQPPQDMSFRERMLSLEQQLSPFMRSRPLSKRCALVVVDMQRFFLEEQSHAFLPDAPNVKRNVLSLLQAWRGSGLPVFFTRHAHPSGDLGALGRWWRDPLMDSSDMSELAIEPAVGEYVIVKDRYDAFHNTELDRALENTGVNEILITGVMTDLCVETTARSAFVRDYDVTVAADACCTQTWELHHASLLTLAHGFAIIKNTASILEEARRL